MDDKATTEARIFKAAAEHGREMTKIAREANKRRERQTRTGKGRGK